MRVEPVLENKAIHEILMRILKRWRPTPAAKQGVVDEGPFRFAIAEEELRKARGIREKELDIKQTIILSPNPSNMNSGTLNQKPDEPVVLSPGPSRAGSPGLPSRKGDMEQTYIVPDTLPRDSDVYETVILNPKDWNTEASALKGKGNLLDTVLVQCAEESTDRKRAGETLIQGTGKTGRSESKSFEEIGKPPKGTGGSFPDQTIIVGSGNEKERE